MKTLITSALFCLSLTGISQTRTYQSQNFLYTNEIQDANSSISFDELKNYPELEEVDRFPTICQNFNVVGQKACLRYVIDRGLLELQDFYGLKNYESFTGRVYFRKGELVALRLFEPPFETKTAETALKKIQDNYYHEFNPRELKNLDSFYIDVKLNGSISANDKPSPYEATVYSNYFQNKLKHFKSNEDTLAYLHTLKRASSAIFSQPDTSNESNSFVLQHLALINLHHVASIEFDHEKISVSALMDKPTDTVAADTVKENVPILPGCEKAQGNEQLKHCFSYKLQMLVVKKFEYPKEARRKNIQGKGIVSFLYTKEGKVSKVRLVKAVHPLIDLEYIRVVTLFPDLLVPAQQRGNKVDMSFTIPINARLQ